MTAATSSWATPEGWTILHPVFDDVPAGIGVALLSGGTHTMLGLRWHPGSERVQSWPGQSTGYFLVPFTFAAAIARSLLTMRACGSVPGFHETGLEALVHWLSERSAVDDALCY